VGRLLVTVGAAVLLGGCATGAKETPPPLTAVATLKDRDGQEVGRATLVETAAGVRIGITGYRLPPGPKGLVLTTVGTCQPPEFLSAGARRSPGGDLPGMTVSVAGEGGIDAVAPTITLERGSRSVFTDNGTAILVLDSPDGARKDPTGTGGTRIACGVIVRK
jgi:superoxide dismutase, Cu-Zn family